MASIAAKLGRALSEGSQEGKEKAVTLVMVQPLASCEEANRVEACTITAPDVITAFAVPNPNHPSQSCRFFQVWRPSKLPHRPDHPIYFRLVKFYLNQPFRSSTVRKLDGRSIIVNAAFRCKRPRRLGFSRHIQFVDGASVAGHENCNNSVLHKNFHSLQIGGSKCPPRLFNPLHCR
jgi:hypothetical protein